MIEIQITQDPLRSDEVCDQIPRRFTRAIKVDTAHLEVGEYQYKVNNDQWGGSFIISSDTLQTGECGGNPENDHPDCGLRFPGASTPIDYDQGGYPVYSFQDSTLTLPRVDTPDQVGRYQNVVMRFDSPRNAWILESFDSRDNAHHSPAINFVVSTVTVVNAFLTPQVSLYVSGVYTCGRIGQINQRRSDDLFEIQITLDPLQPEEACDQIMRNFIRVIQLDTFRLEAGEYRYAINSANESDEMLSDSFILPVETFPVPHLECGGNPEDDDSDCIIPI